MCCATITHCALLLSKITTPATSVIFLSHDLVRCLVPCLNFFPKDARLQRTVLLLLFNAVYESSAGKGQLVRSGGVEAVVSSIKRGLDEGDRGTVTVVHGMGVMFDLLRIDFEGQEGTCLNAVAAKAVREAAKAKVSCGSKRGKLNRIGAAANVTFARRPLGLRQGVGGGQGQEVEAEGRRPPEDGRRNVGRYVDII